jgi:hypothetical protein
MPRKNRQPNDSAGAGTTSTEASDASTAVLEPKSDSAPRSWTHPGHIDGPPVAENGEIIAPAEPQAKNWGHPYKSIFASPEKGFEMGENRRFKQRVFKFSQKPADEVLTALKEAGFTYRPNEKAWTIQANPDTRRLSDDLAREFAGGAQGMSR